MSNKVECTSLMMREQKPKNAKSQKEIRHDCAPQNDKLFVASCVCFDEDAGQFIDTVRRWLFHESERTPR